MQARESKVTRKEKLLASEHEVEENVTPVKRGERKEHLLVCDEWSDNYISLGVFTFASMQKRWVWLGAALLLSQEESAGAQDSSRAPCAQA
ncbi:hypothetical protein E5288_WYG005643 [Bos mutus]|uniref:Uncharacterized protein n=1 Tax=Bos mutus TaxID=72004 RepID=A0A6B0RLK7_9CETA|nr:hypothetical protein [Bos mutus]